MTGIGQTRKRKADLVLHGHIHRHNEWRLAEMDGDIALYFDFYTRNIHHYYPTRFGDYIPIFSELIDLVTYVDVVSDAPANNEPAENTAPTKWKYAVTFPHIRRRWKRLPTRGHGGTTTARSCSRRRPRPVQERPRPTLAASG